jgi:hypothetical protein
LHDTGRALALEFVHNVVLYVVQIDMILLLDFFAQVLHRHVFLRQLDFNRAALLRGTFVEPFRPVEGMADLYRAWSRSGVQFHYLSATPWQLYVPIATFADTHGFPKGTFHLRDFRWRDRSFFNMFTSPDRYKMRTIEPTVRPSTFDSYGRNIRNHVIAFRLEVRC